MPLQVHPIPLSDVRAIHKHTPPLGQHRITLTLATGVSLPSLHFQNVRTVLPASAQISCCDLPLMRRLTPHGKPIRHPAHCASPLPAGAPHRCRSQGGIKSFLSCLREHGPLVRSADDPNTYLINDTTDPLQRSLL